MAQQPEPQIQIRKVTQLHATVTQDQPGEDCTYVYQFILDGGAEERLWTLGEDDADQVLDLIQASGSVSLDVGRNTLIFKDVEMDD